MAVFTSRAPPRTSAIIRGTLKVCARLPQNNPEMLILRLKYNMCAYQCLCQRTLHPLRLCRIIIPGNVALATVFTSFHMQGGSSASSQKLNFSFQSNSDELFPSHHQLSQPHFTTFPEPCSASLPA